MLLGKKKDSEKNNGEEAAVEGQPQSSDTAKSFSRPSGLGDFSIRRMRAEDEDTLSDKAKAKDGKNLSEFVCNILGIDMEELLKWPLGDKIFALLEIRKLSKGSEYDIEIKCPYCDHKQWVYVDVKKLEIIKLDQEKVDDKLQYELTLPYSGKKIKIKILRVEDEAELMKGQQNHASNSVSFIQMMQTVELEGVRVKNINIFKQMDSEDIGYLREQADVRDCGVKNDYPVVCVNGQCLQEINVQVPIDYDFFLQKKKRKAKTSARAI
jgi:hypothetical protein